MSNVKTQHEKDLVSNCNSVFKDRCEEHIKHTWKGLFPWPTASTEGFRRNLMTVASGWKRAFRFLLTVVNVVNFCTRCSLTHTLFHSAHVELFLKRGMV